MKVEPYDLLHLPFYDKSPFTGSVDGVRYRIEKSVTADEAGGEEKRLKVWLYPEPYAFEHTEDALKYTRYFPYTENALTDIAEWLSGVGYDKETGAFTGL